MGIKTKISNNQLPKKYQKYNLIETSDGITDTVYLLDDIYVLKVFEEQTENQLKNEQTLLIILQDLKVPKVVDTLIIDNKKAIIYTQIVGKSIKHPTINEIEQIGLFLKEQHKLTKNRKSSNKKLYEKDNLKELILLTKNNLLLDYFLDININLKDDGLIHGDIFPDNVKFKDNKLMGVYDYNEACQGDFLFDLAVIASSWCFDESILNKDKLSVLINIYDKSIDKIKFIEYIKYSLLYYIVTRLIDNYNSDDLIKKLSSTLNIKKDQYEN